jgi:serine/threonine protein kinase
MELVSGGELFDRIVDKGNYSEKDAAGVIAQLCAALAYLHDKKIVHRDLKPENLLYAAPSPDETLKVADFGLARKVAKKGEMMKTACGTPGYVAPEILANKGYDNTAVDMWSVGVILYILLCGFPPFYEEELPALFDSILKARYDFPSPWWDTISPQAKSLVKACLTIKADQRMTARQMLEEPWVASEAPATSLAGSQKALKKYMANQRLRKAALGIIAKKRLERALEDLRAKVSE